MTVTKILNGGGGLRDDLINGASRLFPRAALFSAYVTDHCVDLSFLNNEK
jgi:o-succinylbenzoate---CoA ligase